MRIKVCIRCRGRKQGDIKAAAAWEGQRRYHPLKYSCPYNWQTDGKSLH
jgi:hypothetical protein